MKRFTQEKGVGLLVTSFENSHVRRDIQYPLRMMDSNIMLCFLGGVNEVQGFGKK